MNEYMFKLKAVIGWCLLCDWSVTDFSRLFNLIYNVLHYRQLWANAKTPETTALAAWSRDLAIDDLHEFMKARCFPEGVSDAVIWLCNH